MSDNESDDDLSDDEDDLSDYSCDNIIDVLRMQQDRLNEDVSMQENNDDNIQSIDIDNIDNNDSSSLFCTHHTINILLNE